MTGKSGKMFYEIRGKEEAPMTLLIIHGWQCTHEHTMAETLRFYENEYKCVYVDLLGYGESDMYDEKSKKPIPVQCVDEILVLIDTLKLENIIIYGTCTGGNIGSIICVERPKLVIAFVWIDGYLFIEGVMNLLVIPGVRNIIYKVFLQSKTGIWIANLFARFYDKISDDYIERQKNQSVRVSLDYINGLYVMAKDNFIRIVEEVPQPSLYIIGENTAPTVKKSQAYWLKHAQHPYVEKVSNSSHFALFENPEELNAKIKTFLKKVL